MPFYSYKCPKCGNIELQRKMTMPEIKQCPTCKSEIQKVSGLDILKDYEKYLSTLTPEQLIKELKEAGMDAYISEDGVGKVMLEDEKITYTKLACDDY